MTEKDFWDKFNEKHNPKYYYATKNKTKINKMKLAFPVNEGWLYNKDKYSVKLFASYDRDEDGSLTFGDRTMIPLACVKRIQKL